MPRLDLEQLHTFVTIAACGSISAATPILHRSPSALSEQLQKLEVACQALLMTRGQRGMSLTAAGEMLLPLAHDLLEMNNRAMAKMLGTAVRGHLKVAITDYFLPHSIAPLLRQINKIHPELQLEVLVLSSAQILDTLAQRKFDICIYFRLTETYDALVPEEVVLRSESVHWVAHQAFELQALKPLPLLTLPPSCQLQAMAVARLKNANTPFIAVHSASSLSGLLSAVQAGLGVSCLNASSVTDEMVLLDGRPGLPAMPDMQLCLHNHAPMKTGATALADFIKAFCPPLSCS